MPYDYDRTVGVVCCAIVCCVLSIGAVVEKAILGTPTSALAPLAGTAIGIMGTLLIPIMRRNRRD